MKMYTVKFDKSALSSIFELIRTEYYYYYYYY